MGTYRVLPILLLGMCMAGMSGLAVARDGYRGHGGYSGRSHVGVRVVVDPFLFVHGYYPSPYYYPSYYYSPPYYYPPAVLTVPATPPTYIEREENSEPAPQASASWYYCAAPQAYYPYVKQCPGGWQAVPPRPSDTPGEER